MPTFSSSCGSRPFSGRRSTFSSPSLVPTGFSTSSRGRTRKDRASGRGSGPWPSGTGSANGTFATRGTRAEVGQRFNNRGRLDLSGVLERVSDSLRSGVPLHRSPAKLWSDKLCRVWAPRPAERDDCASLTIRDDAGAPVLLSNRQRRDPVGWRYRAHQQTDTGRAQSQLQV